MRSSTQKLCEHTAPPAGSDGLMHTAVGAIAEGALLAVPAHAHVVVFRHLWCFHFHGPQCSAMLLQHAYGTAPGAHACIRHVVYWAAGMNACIGGTHACIRYVAWWEGGARMHAGRSRLAIVALSGDVPPCCTRRGRHHNKGSFCSALTSGFASL